MPEREKTNPFFVAPNGVGVRLTAIIFVKFWGGLDLKKSPIKAMPPLQKINQNAKIVAPNGVGEGG